ncbi:MAG: DNA alkylation repair protein [Acidobacteriota bacterium]|nr:DNA alkylation repair protein [Acidobacteriota bacterium]
MKIHAEISYFEESLRAEGRPTRASGEKRYLKSTFDFLGVTTPVLRRVVATWLRRHPQLSRDELARLSRALFRRRIHELKVVAIVLLERRQQLLVAGDIDTLEWMLRRSFTWAYVDALAIHVVGPLVERRPELNARLDAWALDPDFWLRRAALLALLLPLRRGGGDWTRFVRYADGMLAEHEFFIRKAIGWVLREVAKNRPPLVETFLRRRLDSVSGVTVREGVKYLGPCERDVLLAGYRANYKRGKSTRRRESSSGRS